MDGQQKNTEKLRNFSARLRGRMAALNLQANELAAKLGVANSAVTNWRLGTNGAKGKTLRRLAEILSCDPTWLSGAVEVEGLNEPAPGQPDSPEEWRRRALAAERKLAAMHANLRSLLEVSGANLDARVADALVSDALAAEEESAHQPLKNERLQPRRHLQPLPGIQSASPCRQKRVTSRQKLSHHD